MSQSTPENNNHKWVSGIIAFTTPIFVATLTGLTAWISKIDDRQYVINQEYVSKAELKQAILNISDTMEDRRKEQAAQMQLILNEIRATNQELKRLAITIERRTKSDDN